MNKIKRYVSNQNSIGRYPSDICHHALFSSPLLSYDKIGDEADFTDKIRERFLSVLGDMPRDFEPVCREQERAEFKTFTRIRMVIETEKDCFCPCYLLLPKGVEKPPVVICLQGHSMGMMVSLGEGYGLNEALVNTNKRDSDFALQAVSHGYAAMVVEQRGFGERISTVRDGAMCDFLAHTALLVGRTLIGERVWDVKQVINVLGKRSDVNGFKVGIMGNSGGGTASYYAACFDDRIRAVMSSCSVCGYFDSIGTKFHCACNYLPSAAKYFDMGELAALIHPRPIVVVAGKFDPIFPFSGVLKVYDVMKKIYADSPENLKLVVGKGAHRFYREGWTEFDKLFK